jgi:hypothetical protein
MFMNYIMLTFQFLELRRTQRSYTLTVYVPDEKSGQAVRIIHKKMNYSDENPYFIFPYSTQIHLSLLSLHPE